VKLEGAGLISDRHLYDGAVGEAIPGDVRSEIGNVFWVCVERIDMAVRTVLGEHERRGADVGANVQADSVFLQVRFDVSLQLP